MLSWSLLLVALMSSLGRGRFGLQCRDQLTGWRVPSPKWQAHLHAGVVMLGRMGNRFLLRRSRRGIRCGFADRKLHGRDFLHLVDNDLLRDAAQLFVLAVAQFADSHSNGALMMRDHHRHEIT